MEPPVAPAPEGSGTEVTYGAPTMAQAAPRCPIQNYSPLINRENKVVYVYPFDSFRVQEPSLLAVVRFAARPFVPARFLAGSLSSHPISAELMGPRDGAQRYQAYGVSHRIG
jgi:hypothetical protein